MIVPDSPGMVRLSFRHKLLFPPQNGNSHSDTELPHKHNQSLLIHTGGTLIIIYTLLWPLQAERQYVTQGLDSVWPHGPSLLLLM